MLSSEATWLIIDAIGTMYASGAAGNGNKGDGKVSMWNAWGGQQQASCVERRSALDPRTESDTTTDKKLLSLLLLSFWATVGLVKMFGCSIVVAIFMVYFSMVIFLGWTMQWRIALWTQNLEQYNSDQNLHYDQIKGAEQSGAL